MSPQNSNYEPTTHPVHSDSWVMFTQVSFVTAIVALGAGIALLDADLAARGYLAMGALLTIITSITMSKTIRDKHEAERLTKRVESAKVSEFLMKHDPLAT